MNCREMDDDIGTEPGNHVGDRIDITDVGVAEFETFGAMLQPVGVP